MLRHSCALALAAVVNGQQPPPESHLDELALASHLRFLSHDLLEGRGVGTRGEQLARLYIQTQMRLCGLEPGAKDGSWEQPFPVLGITSKTTRTLSAKGPQGEATFEAPRDFTATAASPEDETTWKDTELVFVGYGIEAKEQSWDDFKGIDLKGKVLLVMNNDPSDDPALFGGKTRLYYGRWTYKFEEAARRGAAGAIVIHTEVSAGYPFQVIQTRQGKEELFLPFDKATPALPIRSWCSEEAARKLCALGGFDLDALRKGAETRAFKPQPLGVKLDLALENTLKTIETANVVGKVPGSGDAALAGQAVVVTAHYDHLGIGPAKKGDSIYNGALDNASGVAAMLALAKAVHASHPQRTVYFVGCTGEESGLFGSEYFAKHPPIARSKLVANFNIDGINVWGRTKDLQEIGHGKTSLTALAERVARTRGREIRPDSQPELGLYYRSDHFSFARVGVPSFYLKAGDHFLENPEGKSRIKAMFTTVHYHQPSDEFDERWDLSGAVEDLRLLLECVVLTANDKTPPTWTKGDEFEKLRDLPDEPDPSDFARFRRITKDDGLFETAITSYEKDGVKVDLVAAVHIADAEHYAALNEKFKSYDALLYELVAAQGTRPDKERRPRGVDPLTLIQSGLKNGLQLAFQLDGVDYKAANFVHADLSPQEFAASMKERGESILSLVWNMMLSGMSQGQPAGNEDLASFDVVKAFRNKEGRHSMRMTLASQLTNLEAQAAGFSGGAKGGSTLVEVRNDRALSVLDTEIKSGKKALGIYYGAAHMPDMEKKLLAKGFRKTGEQWLVAWNITKRPDK